MVPEEIKILIVDDDPFVRDMVGLILQEAGYDTDMAKNGLEAMEKCRNVSGFHVVISDMNMPEMDGPTLIREIRKTYPDSAIILMTGNEDRSYSFGDVDEYVVKNENIQETITSLVDKVLGKKNLRV